MKKIMTLSLVALVSASGAMAQDEAPKFKVNPTGRVLMDGALYASPQKENWKDGVAIPDVRLGAKMSYGKWSAKIDVSFAQAKIGLKDLFIQYNFTPGRFIKAGNFIHGYGLQPPVSSSMKPTFEEPVSNAVFNCARQIGVQFLESNNQYLGTFSAHANTNASILSPNDEGQQSYGFTTRQVWRPIHSNGNIVQVGISGSFMSPTKGEGFSFSGNFPTKVDKVKAVGSNLTDAMNQFKFTPELLLSCGPVALEAQYFYNRVNMRHDLHNYTGQGGYANLRGLLLGDKSYGYVLNDGVLATPSAGTLELVLGYNYTSLCDKKAEYFDGVNVVSGIYGGRINTFSATMNYYINKYMLCRLNYTYAHNWQSSVIDSSKVNMIQARFQVIF